MDISITWNPGDTWRKLGYLNYTNSLNYRAVIDQNPQWSALEKPPVGTVLSLDVNDSRTLAGTNNSLFFVDTQDAGTEDLIFPFDYKSQYDAQAAKYSLYGLVNYNELNGYTMDTQEALTGNR